MRKPNYRYERAERDRAKKARKDEKLQRQQQRAATRTEDGVLKLPCDADAPRFGRPDVAFACPRTKSAAWPFTSVAMLFQTSTRRGSSIPILGSCCISGVPARGLPNTTTTSLANSMPASRAAAA